MPFTLLSVRYFAAVITPSFLMLPRRQAFSRAMLEKSLLLGLVLTVAARVDEGGSGRPGDVYRQSRRCVRAYCWRSVEFRSDGEGTA